jgi:hypothetical protein
VERGIAPAAKRVEPETPLKQAGLCAAEPSVSSRIYTISSGRLPRRKIHGTDGILRRRLLCFAAHCLVQLGLQIGHFLFGVGNCLLLGFDLVFFVLHRGGACFVG